MSSKLKVVDKHAVGPDKKEREARLERVRLKECDGCIRRNAPKVERHSVVGYKYVFELVSAKECVEFCV